MFLVSCSCKLFVVSRFTIVWDCCASNVCSRWALWQWVVSDTTPSKLSPNLKKNRSFLLPHAIVYAELIPPKKSIVVLSHSLKTGSGFSGSVLELFSKKRNCSHESCQSCGWSCICHSQSDKFNSILQSYMCHDLSMSLIQLYIVVYSTYSGRIKVTGLVQYM